MLLWTLSLVTVSEATEAATFCGASAADVARRRRRDPTLVCACRRRSSGSGFLGSWLPEEDEGTGWKCRGTRMVRDDPLPWQQPPAPPSVFSRRRREATMGSCRRRQAKMETEDGQLPVEDQGVPWRCEGDSMVPQADCSACLCVFDIDRTLTGKQGDLSQCPANLLRSDLYDSGYGGGPATLSNLSKVGIRTTFCNECYLGITSAGIGSGPQSDWNHYILAEVMRGDLHDNFTQQFPDSARWSFGMGVTSPYILGQPDRFKQNAVEKLREWYGEAPRGRCIKPENVYFFGDRTENIKPFAQKEMNSRQVSCAARDHQPGDMIGLCGGSPDEIQRRQGNILCSETR